MSEITDWHYIDGPRRVGPFNDVEWAELVRDGIVKPETKVWNEQLAGWAPYASVVERFPLPEGGLGAPEDEAGSPPPLPRAQETTLATEILPPEEALAAETEALKRDYVVTARECLRRSWMAYRRDIVPLSGATMFTWLIVSIGSSLPSLLAVIMPLGLNGVFQGGLYSIFIKALRNERGGIGDLFSGFRKGIFANLVMRTLIGSMVLYASIFAGVLALQMMGLQLEETKDPAVLVQKFETFFTSLDGLSLLTVGLLLFVCLLPALFLWVCWIFSIPLIRDHGMPWPVALRLSRRKVQQHPVVILRVLLGITLVSMLPTFLITLLVGIFSVPLSQAAMLLVGVLVSMPIFVGALMSLYEAVFPRWRRGSLPRREAAEEP